MKQERMELHELRERVQSIHNRCEVFDVLWRQGREDLFPIVLEDLYEDAQRIALEYCTIEE